MYGNPNDSISFDPTEVVEAQGFAPAPAGKYLARIIDVTTDGQTQDGYSRWGLRFEFAAQVRPDGVVTTRDDAKGWAGHGCWDNLVFSDKAAGRVKLVLGRLGLDMSRKLDLTSQMILGRWAILEVGVEEYTHEGKSRRKNAVAFAGYEGAPVGVVEQLMASKKAPKLVAERPAKGGVDTSFDTARYEREA